MRRCLTAVLRAAIWPLARWFVPSARRGWRCWRCGIPNDLRRTVRWEHWYCPVHEREPSC